MCDNVKMIILIKQGNNYSKVSNFEIDFSKNKCEYLVGIIVK